PRSDPRPPQTLYAVLKTVTTATSQAPGGTPTMKAMKPVAAGVFLVGRALDAAGFIETVAGQPAPTQPDSALFAIRLAIGPLPTLCLIGGLVLAYFYPITSAVHHEILLKLKERKQKQNSGNELPGSS
ncbi:MAG: hypothetical protein F6K19_20045, partial [Cyanothece sp. SIO1E1]|nr:hypothetical protein [Cyanothece sp. SIO1E1]